MRKQLIDSQVDRSKVLTLKKVITNEWSRAFAIEVEKHMGDTSIKNTLVPSMNEYGVIVTGLEKLSKEYIDVLEKELFIEAGQLSNKKSDYWLNFSIDVPVKGVRLVLQNPQDLVNYLVLISKNNVAGSLKEIDSINTTNNSMLYVLTDEEDQAVMEISKAQSKIESYATFNSMTPNEIKEVLIYLGRDVYNTSEAVLKARLYQEIEVDPDRFLGIVNNPYFQDMVLLNKAIHYRTIYKKGNTYWFNDVMIGSDIYKAIEYLNSPNNSYLKTTILEGIRDKETVANPSYVQGYIHNEVNKKVASVLQETHGFKKEEVEQFVDKKDINTDGVNAKQVENEDLKTRKYTKRSF